MTETNNAQAKRTNFNVAVKNLVQLSDKVLSTAVDKLNVYFPRLKSRTTAQDRDWGLLDSPDNQDVIPCDNIIEHLAGAIELAERRQDKYARNLIDIAAPDLPHMRHLQNVCRILQNPDYAGLLTPQEVEEAKVIEIALGKVQEAYKTLPDRDKKRSFDTIVTGHQGARIVRLCGGNSEWEKDYSPSYYNGDAIIELGIETLPIFFMAPNVHEQYWSSNVKGNIDLRVIMEDGAIHTFNFKPKDQEYCNELLPRGTLLEWWRKSVEIKRCGETEDSRAAMMDKLRSEEMDFYKENIPKWVKDYPPCVNESGHGRGGRRKSGWAK